MTSEQLAEIKYFWRCEIDGSEYDNIVDVKQMAKSDIYDLIDSIEKYKNELHKIVNEGTFGTHVETKEVIRSKEGRIAYEALNQMK